MRSSGDTKSEVVETSSVSATKINQIMKLKYKTQKLLKPNHSAPIYLSKKDEFTIDELKQNCLPIQNTAPADHIVHISSLSRILEKEIIAKSNELRLKIILNYEMRKKVLDLCSKSDYLGNLEVENGKLLKETKANDQYNERAINQLKVFMEKYDQIIEERSMQLIELYEKNQNLKNQNKEFMKVLLSALEKDDAIMDIENTKRPEISSSNLSFFWSYSKKLGYDLYQAQLKVNELIKENNEVL
ncbi:hypothetical protein K502DRAFT_367302 [Neoconidiobolus thromboides FSU 785]|nr:hypothetical protein K502DRAFT_367302 [Neoconidiobolus thromboides FSU 785]